MYFLPRINFEKDRCCHLWKMGIVYIQWQKATKKVTGGSFMLWFGIEIWGGEEHHTQGGSCRGLFHGPPAGWVPQHVCPETASPHCLTPGASGLCQRLNKNLQRWSSFGSPELSASPGCPKPFHNMTCLSRHLPCTFSGNRFQKSGWWTPQGFRLMGPEIALSAQQRENSFPFYWLFKDVRELESRTLSASERMPFLSWRTSSPVFNRTHFHGEAGRRRHLLSGPGEGGYRPWGSWQEGRWGAYSELNGVRLFNRQVEKSRRLRTTWLTFGDKVGWPDVLF